MRGRLPNELSLEDGLAAVAQQVVQRLMQEAPPEWAKKLLTEALLLTGLRVRRDVAAKIFRGVRLMQESETYLRILDEGQEKRARKDILIIGEENFGSADETVNAQLDSIADLNPLEGMVCRAVKAASWQEILDTP